MARGLLRLRVDRRGGGANVQTTASRLLSPAAGFPLLSFQGVAQVPMGPLPVMIDYAI